MGRTLFDRLWDMHCVADEADGTTLIAIDRVLLHERTGGVALQSLTDTNRSAIAPDRVFAIMDHIVSFREGRSRDEARLPGGEIFITKTREMATSAGIHLIDTDNKHQGIVHVVAPELGIVYPGLSVVCPDSHTCSLGALGALAIGVGSSEAEHAIATGVIRIRKPEQMRINLTGALRESVTTKDLALHLIATYGADGAKRRAIEFAGDAISDLTLEARLTLCNLAVEFGAFTAIIKPDDIVFDYVKGRPFAPYTHHWVEARAGWSALSTDLDAQFEDEITIDLCRINPMVSWGTSPEHSVEVSGSIPAIETILPTKQKSAERAMRYMDVFPGQSLSELEIQGAFIGSCTNGRLSDLIAAAAILKDRTIAREVKAVCVPGSREVKRQAEAMGIDRIFKAAGFEWGDSGCAMCFYAGGETFSPSARIVSSTNRNFEGRQGPGVRTHLTSPAIVAASAIAGYITSDLAEKTVGGRYVAS